MRSLTRRTFAKLSAAAAATAVGPILAGRRLAASVTPQDDSLQSEFLIDLTLEAQSPHEVGGAGGGRLVVPVAGGTFQGPRMKGTVITPSGDWILERPDGSRVLDVRLPRHRHGDDEGVQGEDIEQAEHAVLVEQHEAHQHQAAGEHMRNVE